MYIYLHIHSPTFTHEGRDEMKQSLCGLYSEAPLEDKQASSGDRQPPLENYKALFAQEEPLLERKVPLFGRKAALIQAIQVVFT